MNTSGFQRRTPPQSEEELLARANAITGMSFAQVASILGIHLPASSAAGKGWLGGALERLLGSSAGSKAEPDFVELGIELKTLPLKASYKPAESTFVTTLHLSSLNEQTWETSSCFAKLRRVLWFPVEGERSIPFSERRIGAPILWSPSPEEEGILSRDWQELTLMASTGRLEEIHAGLGEYLQIRPKAANNQALVLGYDATGQCIRTLPRGFYLRPSFTARILRTA
ncbi:DNA mismatch repair protein [Legionella geestiana]|uniref:DNA mismatch repair protein MutH n=1 Tax=Legionella geestiana TaxID=45065 RepID=A0A0W0U3Q4_9GAMM|nr:DNA mismatch repair endonuclease MutH [Legionella geestiana]KTD02718.1 DNA mismatch repair protein [Legionella geestiana]QBS11281.1 DNA mismatch repair endonuclease MutH [Legionella geestiana]QDQ40976.1 DNA mismatch repair endonuclease MutH [Legionella geestiana]STX54088.1 DNA mismatch repair protein MutH [Legionella geestiana]